MKRASKRKPYAWTEGARLAIDVGSADTAPKKPKPFTASEDHECVAFVAWLEMQISQGASIRFSHIPNETPTSPIQAKRLQRLGVRRGVPDYFLIVKNKPLFIEMKRERGGKVSPQQQAWLDALNDTGRVCAYVCEGASDAKALIQKLLEA